MKCDPGEGALRESSLSPMMRCSTGMIPDRLDRRDPRQVLGWGGLFTRVAETLTWRSEPGEQAAATDEADIQVAETDDMVAGLAFCNAEQFIQQPLTDEDVLASPFDLAGAADASNLMLGVIPRVLRPAWHGAVRGGVEFGRRSLAKCFVRTFLIVMAAEQIKACLLLGCIRRRRDRGLRLQGAMHALVPPVLLRRSRTDEVRHDAKLQPPGRQFGEACSAARAKRRSIVAADRKRQAVLAKGPLKIGPNAFRCRGYDPQLDQKAAVTVRHRQRIDPPLIVGAEPALEVRAPLVVGARHRRAGPPLVERAPPPLPWRDQTRALEDAPDRRGRRPGDLGSVAIEHRQKLAWPQIRKAPPRRDHLLGNLTIGGLWTLQRRMRAILEPFRVAALLAVAPFVKRVATNPIASAQLRHAPVPALVIQKHPDTFFHPTGLLEWHRRALPPMHLETCRQSSRSKLSGIYSVCTLGLPLTPTLSPRRAGRGSSAPSPRRLNAERAGLGGGVALADCLPVHCIPPGLQIIGAAVLVVEVIGVFPHVIAEQRALAVHHRIVLVGT